MEEMLRYFMQRTQQDFNDLHEKVDHVTKRVDDLWSFKIRMVGIFAGVSGLVSVVVTILTLYLRSN